MRRSFKVASFIIAVKISETTVPAMKKIIVPIWFPWKTPLTAAKQISPQPFAPSCIKLSVVPSETG